MLAERLTAQLLAGPPAGTVEDVARRLLAVQAQDARAARLAVRARTAGLTARDVDRALTDARTVVVGWLNRGTLQLVPAEDHAWLHALTAPTQATGVARRLGQEGVSPAAADGPLTRAQLRERVAAAGVRTEGQALVHVLMKACREGIAMRGPVTGREQAYVLVRDWLGEPPPVDRDAALAELARRYLAGHGPASDRDLARWAGLPLRDARAGLAAISRELGERDDGLADLARRPPAAGMPPPRLLGGFEPLLLGWTSREPLLDAPERLITTNGIFRPFALVAGRAVATWTLRAGRIDVTPFARIAAGDAAALDADAADVRRFLA